MLKFKFGRSIKDNYTQFSKSDTQNNKKEKHDYEYEKFEPNYAL